MQELSLNIMDIVQNSICAKATVIKILVHENKQNNLLKIEIKDNGKGINEEQINKILNPFYTTRKTRKVGLGLPLFKMAAESTGGKLEIESAINTGTTVTATFISSSIDMTPLGDINSTINILIKCNPNIDFIFTRSIGNLSFTLDTSFLKKTLGKEVSLDNPEVTKWIKSYLNEQTELITNRRCNSQ